MRKNIQRQSSTCSLIYVSTVGEERASTRILIATASFCFWLIFRNTGPSSTRPPSPSTKIPASRAIGSAG